MAKRGRKAAVRNTAAKRSTPKRSAPKRSAPKRGRKALPDIKGARGGERRAARVNRALAPKYNPPKSQRKAASKAKTSRKSKKSTTNPQAELDAITLALHRAGIPLQDAEGKACANVADRVNVALAQISNVARIGQVTDNAPLPSAS